VSKRKTWGFSSWILNIGKEVFVMTNKKEEIKKDQDKDGKMTGGGGCGSGGCGCQ
jgi:hypothetical protein